MFRFTYVRVSVASLLAATLYIVLSLFPLSAQAETEADSQFYIDQNGSLQMNTNTITGSSQVSEDQMLHFARKVNPKFPAELPALYLAIGNKYGVRGDVAFCQMLKETGYYRFGGDVRASQHNYAGLGASGKGKQGLAFETSQDGVRAHIQHLFAYATKESIPSNEKIIDPRFRYVSRGSAPYWTSLNGRWAVPGRGYGQDILKLHREIMLQKS
ncbi:mannosyl-glycoprotein endo-beta-N-acetylglucosaminidase [Aneurinibacillus soli]|uniref:Mannosyl-glycoprotein endo-beta-N-acetylglucosaminidase n=1 Tax=Aneurinibacillus soli TaxID=1500254 RepID=A0A0U4WLU9_9BACL|nr:glucosaminidase domain-containing protein [Aneurinibacillus soli]PYE59925.1 mannosyl-glycoprotein endo-beta-N-acetylglucosaminidase [Aneurinibacillus soli]BAU29353.1 Mannosyl-glycoprotein endo-beta-N-acetylglucosaminidase [Aneurinibacillus soli]